MSAKGKIKKIPHHLGIILDGNRRWAQEKGLPIFEGHQKGAKLIRQVVQWCKERGVKILTLYVFSTENWKRPKKEIDFLIELGKKIFNSADKNFAGKEGVKIKIVGQKEKLPRPIRMVIDRVEKATEKNKTMTLNFALSYGGRAEIIEAIKKIIKNKIPVDKITENTIKENLWTSDVDLIIRTGKELRLSNFLIWQAAYSELYFCNKYWPEFTEKDLDEAFIDFVNRQRRFGK